MSTPINDKFTEFMKGADDATHLVALDLLSRELERKLTVARTALKELAEYESWSMPDLYSQPCCDGMVESMNTIAKEALKSTEPQP
jgi:hypothetical protein